MLRTVAKRLTRINLVNTSLRRNAGKYQLPTLRSTLRPVGLLLSTVLCQPDGIPFDDLKNYEVDMTTWSESESSIMNLMNVLKESIEGTSKEYRMCLLKQIEITQAATEHGQFSQKWDALPEYRLLADELKAELEKYYSLIRTVGNLASDESLASLLPKPEESLRMISARYQELEQVLQKEIEENKRVELELLKIKRDSIILLKH